MPSYLTDFTIWDAVAFALLFIAWLGVGWVIEHSSEKRPSTSRVMKAYRRDWLREYVTRSPRMFDSSVLSTLRQGPTFFASACMIAIGSGLALLGNTDQLQVMAEDLIATSNPQIVWDAKIMVPVVILTSGLLGFIWAHRLFGYCAVVMSSVPNDPDHPAAYPRAAKAAEININAARSYNRGLRAIYFALASLTWFLGPFALFGGTAICTYILWRREFASGSRAVLMQDDA